MRNGRPTHVQIALTPAERQTLLAWQRSTTIAVGRARRGRVLLLLEHGRSITDIAAKVGMSRHFVYKWIRRFQAHGLAGLSDAEGRGRRTADETDS